jgi:hypothetical protein
MFVLVAGTILMNIPALHRAAAHAWAAAAGAFGRTSSRSGSQ